MDTFTKKVGLYVSRESRLRKQERHDTLWRRLYLSTRHLLQRGHTRIAMLKAFQGFQPGIERRRGYERALKEAGLPVDESLIKNVTFGGKDLAHRVEDLLQDHSVTALI